VRDEERKKTERRLSETGYESVDQQISNLQYAIIELAKALDRMGDTIEDIRRGTPPDG
jgi:hypothetical protein